MAGPSVPVALGRGQPAVRGALGGEWARPPATRRQSSGLAGAHVGGIPPGGPQEEQIRTPHTPPRGTTAGPRPCWWGKTLSPSGAFVSHLNIFPSVRDRQTPRCVCIALGAQPRPFWKVTGWALLSLIPEKGDPQVPVPSLRLSNPETCGE